MGFLLAWFLLDVVGGVFGELLLAITGALDRDKETKPLAMVWFAFVGLALGAGSALAWNYRIGRPGPFIGASLFVAPMLLGFSMQFFGWHRSRRHAISHLATWYGGASLGLGIAAGRLTLLILSKTL